MLASMSYSQCLYQGKIIAQYAPAVLEKNTPTEVWVKAVNTSETLTWKADTVPGERVMLGIQPDQTSQPWTFGRVLLQEDVAPGDTTIFRFNISNPTAGRYPFRWRLLYETHCWFGNRSANDSVEVIDQHFGGDSIHHIQVMAGAANSDKLTNLAAGGAQFIPRGVNHTLSVQGHVFFSNGTFDEDEVMLDLYRMRKLGFNTVRVFMHPNDLTKLDNGVPVIDGAYLANVTTFLKRCREQHIYVMLTFDTFLGTDYSRLTTPNPQIELQNNFYLDSSSVRVRGQLFTDVYQELKNQQAPIGQILSWNFVNELTFHENAKPLNDSTAIVTTADGGQYNMAIQADRDSMLWNNTQFVANTWTAQMKAVDPTGMCTIGWFTPLAVSAPKRPQDPRLTIQGAAVLRNTNIDYIDLHAYPNNTVERKLIPMLQSMGFDGFDDKPVIMGEYGFLMSEFGQRELSDTAKYWMIDGCNYGIDGWVFWTWDRYQTPTRFYHLQGGDFKLTETISPNDFPVVCTGFTGNKAASRKVTFGQTHQYTAFPNPVSDQLVLDLGSSEVTHNITLINNLGKVLWQGSSQEAQTRIDMNQYPAGLYFVQISVAGKSNQVATLKVINK